MNPKIKDVLGWAGIAGIVVFIAAGLRFTSAYSNSVAPAASFAVTGDGHTTAVPDVAQISFGITTEGGKDIGALQKDNTAKANAAIDYLKSEGIDPKDVETQDYSISPRYQYQGASCPVLMTNVEPRPCPPAGIAGYTINQTLSVKIRDFSKIGDILNGVASRGANNISGLNFTLHDPTQPENEARAKAIAQAQAKAEDMAKAGHFRLGRILSIQEGYNPSPMTYNRSFAAGAPMDTKAIAPSIQPGSQEVTSQVTITYAID